MTEGRYAGLGAPGERQSGTRDIETEVVLTGAQFGARWLIDLLTVVMALVFAFALGGIGVWLALTAFAFLYTDYATERLARVARNPRIVALIYSAEVWLPWIILFAGLPLLRLVMPYEWAFDFATRQHYLIILRDAVWTAIDPATGLTVEMSGPDNIVRRFPLLIRIVLLALPVTYWLTAGVGRRRFKNELDAYTPLRAVDPAAAGTDPRDWKPQAPPATLTVRVETVARQTAARRGSALQPGDRIVYGDIEAPSTKHWEFVTHAAYRGRFPTEEQATQMGGFTQTAWRTFRKACVDALLVEQAGNGDHGQNAGYQFTEAGLEFFRNKRWEEHKQ